jgi:hypothetical protein
MSRCDQKKGLFGRCTRESLHPGDHDNGKVTWPRMGGDLMVYQYALQELERRRAQQRQLQELAERHERGEF